MGLRIVTLNLRWIGGASALFFFLRRVPFISLMPIRVIAWPRFGYAKFEPATTEFWNSVREVRPDLYKGFNPWDRICDPGSLRALLAEAGIQHAEVIAEAGEHPLPSPEAWWSAVL